MEKHRPRQLIDKKVYIRTHVSANTVRDIRVPPFGSEFRCLDVSALCCFSAVSISLSYLDTTSSAIVRVGEK